LRHFVGISFVGISRTNKITNKKCGYQRTQKGVENKKPAYSLGNRGLFVQTWTALNMFLAGVRFEQPLESLIDKGFHKFLKITYQHRYQQKFSATPLPSL